MTWWIGCNVCLGVCSLNGVWWWKRKNDERNAKSQRGTKKNTSATGENRRKENPCLALTMPLAIVRNPSPNSSKFQAHIQDMMVTWSDQFLGLQTCPISQSTINLESRLCFCLSVEALQCQSLAHLSSTCKGRTMGLAQWVCLSFNMGIVCLTRIRVWHKTGTRLKWLPMVVMILMKGILL